MLNTSDRGHIVTDASLQNNAPIQGDTCDKYIIKATVINIKTICHTIVCTSGLFHYYILLNVKYLDNHLGSCWY